MSLTRSYSANETVLVQVVANEQTEGEPFEGEDGVLDVDVGVSFTVQVEKGENSLV